MRRCIARSLASTHQIASYWFVEQLHAEGLPLCGFSPPSSVLDPVWNHDAGHAARLPGRATSQEDQARTIRAIVPGQRSVACGGWGRRCARCTAGARPRRPCPALLVRDREASPQGVDPHGYGVVFPRNHPASPSMLKVPAWNPDPTLAHPTLQTRPRAGRPGPLRARPTPDPSLAGSYGGRDQQVLLPGLGGLPGDGVGGQHPHIPSTGSDLQVLGGAPPPQTRAVRPCAHRPTQSPTLPVPYRRALNACPIDRVRVVVLGQDPYHGPGQAMGMSFSVAPAVPLPSSLRNIFKELRDDVGCVPPGHGDLSKVTR